MDRLFVVDLTALPEFGSDGDIIRYICDHYARRCLDRVIYADSPSKEKSVTYRGIKYRVIPITSVEKTEKYLKNVYHVNMPPIEVPAQLTKYRPGYKVMQGKDIPKESANNKYFIKRIDKLKSWNSLLYDGDVSAYIELEALYSVSPRVNILSEWRVFVHNRNIAACQNYLGSPITFPDPELIQEMVSAYTDNAPGAYTLDVAVIRDKEEKISTIPLEVHPFVACGLYGFEDREVLDMWDEGLQWYIQV